MSKQATPLEKNWLEWLVFAMGCVLVAGVVGYLTYSSLTQGSSPPDIHITTGAVQRNGGHFLVPVELLNRGDQTAENVLIEVKLESENSPGETASFQAAFLPRHSRREGAVVFRNDPRQGKLSARVLGYEKP